MDGLGFTPVHAIMTSLLAAAITHGRRFPSLSDNCADLLQVQNAFDNQTAAQKATFPNYFHNLLAPVGPTCTERPHRQGIGGLNPTHTVKISQKLL
jgi:hypothetical protein